MPPDWPSALSLYPLLLPSHPHHYPCPPDPMFSLFEKSLLTPGASVRVCGPEFRVSLHQLKSRSLWHLTAQLAFVSAWGGSLFPSHPAAVRPSAVPRYPQHAPSRQPLCPIAGYTTHRAHGQNHNAFVVVPRSVGRILETQSAY